jgi:dihydrodiol dehydrogenase / D-xylose 1-dehydrogenase (NADP)
MKKFGWGFIGAGAIANRFMAGLMQVPDAYLAAVSSRTYERAERFAGKYNAKVYKSTEELIADEDADIVYVATPHTVHRENTLMAIEMGKPVLCEKPMAPNAKMVTEMVQAARKKRVYLMEAMWTRFFPAMKKVREWLDEGRIGKVQFVTADFGYYEEEDPSKIIFDPNTAGGSLLDVGIYPIAFAFMVFGKKPNRITGLADMASTGVDAAMGCTLGFEGGGLALLYSAMNAETPQVAEIIGQKGRIVIPQFWSPREAHLYIGGELIESFKGDHEGEGYQFEIAAVQEDIRNGRLENELMPLDESIAIAEVMDELRSQWGLVYPFEK